MLWTVGVVGIAALALAAPTVSPPSGPGPWSQLGATATSRPGKALHFYRTAVNPKDVGIVVESSSARRIRLLWATDCEVVDDDTIEESHQGTASGVKRVVAYPPVLDGATRCYIWVNASLPGTGAISAAEFATY